MRQWKVGEPIAWAWRLGQIVSRRSEIACKYPKTPHGEKCHLNRQHNCPVVPSENGRYGRQHISRFKQEHLEICDIEADYNY